MIKVPKMLRVARITGLNMAAEARPPTATRSVSKTGVSLHEVTMVSTTSLPALTAMEKEPMARVIKTR